MNLTGIRIKNFRSLESVELKGLRQFNVLIGKNNSGKAGDVIVALNGTRTHTFNQYMFVRGSLIGPEMDLIVWQAGSYHEIKASPPNHKFNADFRDYRSQ